MSFVFKRNFSQSVGELWLPETVGCYEKDRRQKIMVHKQFLVFVAILFPFAWKEAKRLTNEFTQQEIHSD